MNGTLRKTLKIAGMVWASPNTLLGIICSGLLPQHCRTFSFHKETIEIRHFSGPVFSVLRRLGISGLTLGNSVVYTVQPTERLRIHENRHTQQYYILGPLFIPIYYILMAYYGYYNHPLERDARRYEELHINDKNGASK